MKIITKYRLMYLPIAILALPLGLILWLLLHFADWYSKLLCNYGDWCGRKSKMVIRDENGKMIYNPEYLKEKGE